VGGVKSFDGGNIFDAKIARLSGCGRNDAEGKKRRDGDEVSKSDISSPRWVKIFHLVGGLHFSRLAQGGTATPYVSSNKSSSR